MNGYSTGSGEDERELPRSSHNQVCSLLDMGNRCSRVAGNASYSKRIMKTVQQKKLKLDLDPNAHHIYICDYHKEVIQSVRSKRRRKDSCDDGDDSEIPAIDLFQLQVNTLRRYKRHFKISTRPGLNKTQLAEVLLKHFKTIPVEEKAALTYFIYMVKTHKNKLDQKNSGNSDTT